MGWILRCVNCKRNEEVCLCLARDQIFVHVKAPDKSSSWETESFADGGDSWWTYRFAGALIVVVGMVFMVTNSRGSHRP